MMNRTEFLISIVVPCYNEEKNVGEIAERLYAVLGGYDRYEIVFVDDGSSDQTLREIQRLRSVNASIKYVSFTRNFGHQNAIRAGLDQSTGDCVVMMDADLQHPPELIPEMVACWKQGYQVVNTQRKENQSVSFVKRKTANFYYDLLNLFCEIKVERGAADFRLLDRSVVEVLRDLSEPGLFYRGIIPWLGFKQYTIPYFPNERMHGQTHYSIRKMLSLALGGITAFSVKPLRLSTVMGFFISFLTFCYGFYAITMRIFSDQTVSGWASLMTGVFFIGGIQLISLGIIGEYVGSLFIQTKRRPNYVVKEKGL
jgi:polyisoprenyl-phosphate glycosyltransferase